MFLLLSLILLASSSSTGEIPLNGCSCFPTYNTSLNARNFTVVQVVNAVANDSVEVEGWSRAPNGRGTAEILWQCIFTLALCCWTSLCLNVQPRTWSRWRRIHQKIIMSSMSGLGPEFTLQLALGQWSSARRSVQDFRRSGYQDWTIRHAFFADMGGFILQAPDFVEFPLNAKQIHYLVTHNYLPYSSVCLELKVIEDKNKQDEVARFLAVSQLLWFGINCFARVAQGLVLTTMELSILAFIFCTLATYFLWSAKPKDVKTPIILIPNVGLSKILTDAGESAQNPYRYTPLDFIGREHCSWYLYWTYWMNVARSLHMAFPVKRCPIDMIPDDNFPALSDLGKIVLFLFQVTYAGIHLCAWNFHFPTAAERYIWRGATLYIISSMVSFWIVDTGVWRILPKILLWLRSKQQAKRNNSVLEEPDHQIRPRANLTFAARLRNNSPGQDPYMDIPLKALIPITMLGAGYCAARCYIVLESWLSLRELPSSAYETVNWTDFLPHFQ